MVAVSPSIQQRAAMKAPEWIALTMEPESRYENDDRLSDKCCCVTEAKVNESSFEKLPMFCCFPFVSFTVVSSPESPLP